MRIGWIVSCNQRVLLEFRHTLGIVVLNKGRVQLVQFPYRWTLPIGWYWRNKIRVWTARQVNTQTMSGPMWYCKFTISWPERVLKTQFLWLLSLGKYSLWNWVQRWSLTRFGSINGQERWATSMECGSIGTLYLFHK